FPGQGTALVGILDAFWDSKGFTSGEEFRQFCSTVVPLLWYDKAVYTNNEIFIANAGVSNYQGNINTAEMTWTIKDEEGNLMKTGVLSAPEILHGTVSRLGIIEMDLNEVKTPAALTIELQLKDTPFKNSWQIWVYDRHPLSEPGEVIITTSFEEANQALEQGKKVLLTPPLNHIKGITGKFVPVFWSPVHFPNQPGTMGILCDPEHPVFSGFPTEFHSNWQWWDISKFSETLEIDSLKVEPLVTVMDNFFKNRALTNLFEAKAGNGRLVFSSIDLVNHLDRRLATKQLKSSLLSYMNSGAFNPQFSISIEELEGLHEVSEAGAEDVFSIYE
ncbi:MAG: glycoside hydrolase family 2, partial [Bacteroidales bacterium]|nr:glycoside hydrolase family 2 [Bacteroidales bacterium]